MAVSGDTKRFNIPVMRDSMAYDLARQSQTAERYSTAPKQRPKQRPKTQTQPAPKPAAHRAMVIAPAAIVLSVIALAIWIFTLQVKTQISQAQTEIYHLESELRMVEQVQDELEIQYESAFNFTKLEDYAVNTLGMQRPRDEQIYALSHIPEDHAVAVAHNARANGFVDRLEDAIAGFLSYFR